MNSAVRKSTSEIKIFPLLADIASAFVWQKATFIGAYLRASNSTSRKLDSQIHHDACRKDELTSLKVISAQRYYHCVEDHFETFERVYEERFERAYGFYRPYLRSVIYRYLDCGVLCNGFARVRCVECGHEYLLAFSCKRRHFCPSCHQKRIVEFGEWVCGRS
jgi:hypothetical protein